MEKSPETYQDVLAKHIINQGYTIYGGYVYKRLVNGDKTDDIDVHVKNDEDMHALYKNLGEHFDCVQKYRNKKYVTGISMVCPNTRWFRSGYPESLFTVDIFQDNTFLLESDIFKLEYRQIDGKPQIVHKDGNVEQAKNIINQLKKRQFSSWKNMRTKDKQYFSRDKWSDTNSWNFKIKKFIGLVE